MRPTASAVLAGLLLAGVLFHDTSAALAQSRRGAAVAPGYVVAESRWGNGTVSGPVRRGPVGWQVRLPGGNWVDCVRSCSETLRLKTVDFWQTVGRDAPDGGANYLRLQFGF
ncbi:MAG: hypothetical protein ACM31O_09810 [Bacteroidota bacterium]